MLECKCECKKEVEVHWFDTDKEAFDFANQSGRDWTVRNSQFPARTGIIFLD
jgi:hypothetical protein